MAKQIEGVYEAVLECAKKEFLEKGYKDASLRTIAQEAGTSTSSIYTRFGDKEGLFRAIVEPAAEEMKRMFLAIQENFDQLDDSVQQSEMGQYTSLHQMELLDYIYDHFDEFKLLLTSGENSTYQEFLHRVVEIDNQCTMRYIQASGNDAISSGRLTPELSHLLSSAFYTGMFEVVIHDMPKDQAVEHIQRMRRFYIAGWKSIFFGDGGENH